jgi:uncharacterized protein (TIGR02147 family)
MKSIYHYTDFRQYLKDHYEHMKKTTKYFTYRYFSQKTGFRSPNQLQLIMQGKRNLTEKALFRCASALGLNPSETEYFKDLVGYCQAKAIEEKNFYYTRILANKKTATTKEVERGQFEFLTNWYHAAVRELIAITPCNNDYNEIAKKIWPEVTPGQVKKSVELLEKFGLIEKGPDGTFKQTSGGVSVGNEVRDLALVKYHQGMLEISKQALKEQSHEDINISAVTMGISKETYTRIRNEIDEFRRKIRDIAAEDKSAERVYQLNFQLFPLSKNGDKK